MRGGGFEDAFPGDGDVGFGGGERVGGLAVGTAEEDVVAGVLADALDDG